MASDGPRNPSSYHQGVWTNPTYAYSNDGNYAETSYTVYDNLPDDTALEVYGGYGFNIGTDNTIDGIEVTVRCKYRTNGGTCSVALATGGTGKGVERTTSAISTTETGYTLGGSTDTWGASWTPAEVNAIRTWNYYTTDTTNGAHYFDTDEITVKVYYTPTTTPPNQFTFTDQTDANLSTLTYSNTITLTGASGTLSVSFSGSGEYSKNGGAWTSGTGTAVNGDQFQIRLTSSGSYSTGVSGTLTVQGVSDTFTVTTKAQPSGSRSETAGTAESTQTAVYTGVPSQSESAGTSDTPSGANNTAASFSESTGTIGDTPTAVYTGAPSQLENAGTASDTPTAGTTTAASQSESAGTAGDAPSGGTTTAASISESAGTVGDTPTAVYIGVPSQSENAGTAGDTPTAGTTTAASQSESAGTAGDAPDAGTITSALQSENAGTIGDTTDELGPGKQVFVSWAQIILPLSQTSVGRESSAVADTVSGGTTTAVSTAETASTISDTSSGANTTAASISESAGTVGDTPTAVYIGVPSQSENAGTAGDTPTAGKVTAVSQSESAGTTSDTPTAGTSTASSINEPAGNIGDTPTAVYTGVPSQLENAGTAEDTSSRYVVHSLASQSESSAVSDSPSAGTSTDAVQSENAGTAGDTPSTASESSAEQAESAGVTDTPSEITQRPIYPSVEILAGTWTPVGAATLKECIDELTPDQADYMKSAVNPVNDTCQIRYSSPDAPPDITGYHEISYEIRRGVSANLDVQLYARDTLIKTWSHVPVPDVWTTYVQQLPEVDAANIPYADYPNLNLKFVAY